MSKNVGVWVGSLFFLLAATFFYQSFAFPYYSQLGPGPALFPRWLSAILLLLSIIYIVQSVRTEVIVWSAVLPKGRDLINVSLVLLTVIIYILLVSYTGFIIASTVMLFIMLRSSYRWYTALAISLGMSFVLFIAFNDWLEVPLPTGDLWD
jgi:putative tricarboxylic transport membrane protein